MPRGNPSPKLAITVDPDVHARIVAAAGEEGTSVSAWMTNAARRALLVRDGLAAVAEWEAEHGAFTDAELVAARRRVAQQAAEDSPRPERPVNCVYDAGVLIAAERHDRAVWADHRARLELGIVPVTTALVVAQVSRSGRQVQLRRFLRGCDVVAFTPAQAHAVGALLGAAGSSDVVDAHVVVVAGESGAHVLTSDGDDLSSLAAELPSPIRIVCV